jgi:hypothetical protein
MIGPRMRPRFEVVVPGTAAEILNRLSDRLARSPNPCTGSILDRHVRLKICEAERNYWSPELHVDVERHPDGTLLRGLYGPHPSVWTMFVALYAIIGFGGLLGLIVGAAQWSLGTPPTALWAVPGTAVLALLVYFVALSGQRLGYEQMVQLRAFLDASVAEETA